MNKLLLVLTFLATGSSTVAQNNLLLPVGRTPIVGADERADGLMHPTACDEQGRVYVKLLWGEPGNVEPLLRISDKGIVELQFDMSHEMPLRYAMRPEGGVVMFHSDEHGRFLDSLGSDGKLESSLRLEPTPTPFFPSQLAVFQSGEIFISGQQIKPSYKASAAVYNASGALTKQLAFDEDIKKEQEIANDSSAQKLHAEAVNESVATAGDDGLVYLMRPTSPALVFAVSRAGEVVRSFKVTAPAGFSGCQEQIDDSIPPRLWPRCQSMLRFGVSDFRQRYWQQPCRLRSEYQRSGRDHYMLRSRPRAVFPSLARTGS